MATKFLFIILYHAAFHFLNQVGRSGLRAQPVIGDPTLSTISTDGRGELKDCTNASSVDVDVDVDPELEGSSI